MNLPLKILCRLTIHIPLFVFSFPRLWPHGRFWLFAFLPLAFYLHDILCAVTWSCSCVSFPLPLAPSPLGCLVSCLVVCVCMCMCSKYVCPLHGHIYMVCIPSCVSWLLLPCRSLLAGGLSLHAYSPVPLLFVPREGASLMLRVCLPILLATCPLQDG